MKCLKFNISHATFELAGSPCQSSLAHLYYMMVASKKLLLHSIGRVKHILVASWIFLASSHMNKISKAFQYHIGTDKPTWFGATDRLTSFHTYDQPLTIFLLAWENYWFGHNCLFGSWQDFFTCAYSTTFNYTCKDKNCI